MEGSSCGGEAKRRSLGTWDMPCGMLWLGFILGAADARMI